MHLHIDFDAAMGSTLYNDMSDDFGCVNWVSSLSLSIYIERNRCRYVCLLHVKLHLPKPDLKVLLSRHVVNECLNCLLQYNVVVCVAMHSIFCNQSHEWH